MCSCFKIIRYFNKFYLIIKGKLGFYPRFMTENIKIDVE